MIHENFIAHQKEKETYDKYSNKSLRVDTKQKARISETIMTAIIRCTNTSFF